MLEKPEFFANSVASGRRAFGQAVVLNVRFICVTSLLVMMEFLVEVDA